MSFSYRGALPLTSPLFRGRDALLARLVQLCRDEVDAYVIVYGGRQNGKTSLLLRLDAALRAAQLHVCMVDFQGLPRATTADALAFLAAQVADSLPGMAAPPALATTSALQRFLIQALSPTEVGRLVLLLDEVGTLPEPTRNDLANLLRSFFTARLRTSALAKLQVVLVGGIELFNLVASQVSTLHGVCEEIYLDDLAQADAVELIAGGLAADGVPRDLGAALGRAVYAVAAGQPYLTQRLGAALAQRARAGVPLDAQLVAPAAESLLRHDPLLRHLREGLDEYKLRPAAHDLLAGSSRYSRLNDALAQLELLGLAKEQQGNWRVRNWLLEAALRDWLGLPEPQPPIEWAKPKRRQTRAPKSSLSGLVPKLVKVQAGSFIMGSADTDLHAQSDEKPQHSRALPTYWIGETPVTNVQWWAFIEQGGYTNSAYWTETGWLWAKEFKVVQPKYWNEAQLNQINQPVVGISWYEAVAYCRWLSDVAEQDFYLPSEAEWEKAARGPNGLIYPWGNEWRAEHCNSNETISVHPTFVRNFPIGVSHYGALDMAGNILEWCATRWQKSYPYDTGEEEWSEQLLQADELRCLRGGSLYSSQKEVRSAHRLFFEASARHSDIGLRVASRSGRPHPGS